MLQHGMSHFDYFDVRYVWRTFLKRLNLFRTPTCFQFHSWKINIPIPLQIIVLKISQKDEIVDIVLLNIINDNSMNKRINIFLFRTIDDILGVRQKKCVENECCCPPIVNISHFNFT